MFHPSIPSTIFFMEGLSLNLELTGSNRLASQQAPGAHPCFLFPESQLYRYTQLHPDFYMADEDLGPYAAMCGSICVANLPSLC